MVKTTFHPGRFTAGTAIALLAAIFSVQNLVAQERSVLVQSTTSTANSGLYDHILPVFEAETGIDVRVVAVGTGQAIRNAENCDADVLLVHARAAEEAFVAGGGGLERFDLMFNDFVIVGPEEDPAALGQVQSAVDALRQIADAEAVFASRGDDSGTHKKEQALWALAGIDPSDASGSWYLETGAGMGATLNTAVGRDAYTLTDRATWISFANKQDHVIVLQSDPALVNQYGIIQVNPARCPNVAAQDAAIFVDWLLSDHGQNAIADFRVAGQQLFFPNAKATEALAD